MMLLMERRSRSPLKGSFETVKCLCCLMFDVGGWQKTRVFLALLPPWGGWQKAKTNTTLCRHYRPCREIFLQQPCLLELEAPLKICGAHPLYGEYLTRGRALCLIYNFCAVCVF